MANLATAVVESMKRHERKPHDLYETPYEATHALVPLLELSSGATIGEPACATGQISRVLEAHGYEVVSSDLRHTGFGMGGYNYLDANIEYGLVDAIVTNPPFKYAEAFIRKAVVPSAGRCYAAQERLLERGGSVEPVG